MHEEATDVTPFAEEVAEPEKATQLVAEPMEVVARRKVIQTLLNRLNGMGTLMQRARFSRDGAEMAILILQNQSFILNALALLLDEQLAVAGYGREVQVRQVIPGRNGDKPA